MEYPVDTSRSIARSPAWRPSVMYMVLVSYFALFGAIIGVTGVLWDVLQRTLHVSDGVFGIALLVTPLMSVGVLLGISPLTTWAGKKRLALISVALIGFMQVSLAIATGLWAFIAVRAMIGIGYGLLEGTITSTTLDWEQATDRRAMNPMHAAFSGGAVLGALATGALLSISWSYQQVLVILALLAFVLCVTTLPVQFPPQTLSEKTADSNPRATLAWMARQPELIVLMLLALLATTGEALAAFWSVIYLRDLGASLLVSGAALALFNGAMFVGRLINTLIVARFGTRVSLALSGAGVVIATALLVPHDVGMAVAAFVVLGLAVAGVVPTVLSAAARPAPGQTTAIASVILPASFVGFIVTPPLIGWAAAWLGLHAALLVTLGMIGLALIGFIRAVRSET